MEAGIFPYEKDIGSLVIGNIGPEVAARRFTFDKTWNLL